MVDGRNRREGCRIAGVEPGIADLNGTDPIGYILSANIHRRHLSKGQQAMAVARLYPHGEKGGRGKLSQISEGLADNRRTAFNRISQARTVLQFAPDLADGVMDGSVTLDAAYKAATDRKKAKEWFADGLRQLRELAPDLAVPADANKGAYD